MSITVTFTNAQAINLHAYLEHAYLTGATLDAFRELERALEGRRDTSTSEPRGTRVCPSGPKGVQGEPGLG